MTRYLRRFLAAAAMALALPSQAASTITPNYSDLWLTLGEQGWGVNIIQHYDTMFVTLFVYGPDNSARWYHGSAVRTVGASQTQFTGDLYVTSGSQFAQPWNPAVFTINSVGTITFNFGAGATTGTMTYTVSGNPQVTKSIVRHTLAFNNLQGNYIGGVTAQGTNCGNGVQNGPILINGELTVNQSNTLSPSFRIDWVTSAGNASCTFTGPYQQSGRLGSVTGGTWSCSIPGVTNSPQGAFNLSQIEGHASGFSGRFSGNDQNCTYNGFFGGTRDVL
jgi:hypothetical protein